MGVKAFIVYSYYHWIIVKITSVITCIHEPYHVELIQYCMVIPCRIDSLCAIINMQHWCAKPSAVYVIIGFIQDMVSSFCVSLFSSTCSIGLPMYTQDHLQFLHTATCMYLAAQAPLGALSVQKSTSEPVFSLALQLKLAKILVYIRSCGMQSKICGA